MQTTQTVMWAAVLSMVAGCGARHVPDSSAVRVYHPPPAPAPLAPGEPEARPPLEAPLPAQVAVFSADEEVAQRVAEGLTGLQGVAGTYVIPGYLVDGRSAWTTSYTDAYRPRAPLDLEHLRQIAAMAHCDVLIVADRGHRQEVKGNAWVALSPLILPLLFAPFLNVEDQSYLDLHLVEVRQGALYGRLHAERALQRAPSTIYVPGTTKVRDQQLEVLATELRGEVGDLLWHHLLQPRPPGDSWTP